jgi:hypothetical protein
MMTRLHTLTTISFIIFSLIGIHAQNHYSSKVDLGVKGGVTLSQVSFNPSTKQSFAMGTDFGFTFRYIEENHFGLIAELNFEQRGWKEDFEEAPYNYSHTLNYIQIPVMAHIYFGRRGRFFFNAGPEIGFFIGDSTSSNFDPYNTSALPNFPNTNRTNEQMTTDVKQKIDYGISAGLGGEFNINRKNSLYLECRFYYGLGNIFSSKRADTFSASNSMSIMANIGYWFRIK